MDASSIYRNIHMASNFLEGISGTHKVESELQKKLIRHGIKIVSRLL